MYYVVQSLKEYLCCLYTRVQYTYSKQRISKFSGKKGSKYRYSYLFPNFYLTKSIDMALKNVKMSIRRYLPYLVCHFLTTMQPFYLKVVNGFEETLMLWHKRLNAIISNSL